MNPYQSPSVTDPSTGAVKETSTKSGSGKILVGSALLLILAGFSATMGNGDWPFYAAAFIGSVTAFLRTKRIAVRIIAIAIGTFSLMGLYKGHQDEQRIKARIHRISEYRKNHSQEHEEQTAPPAVSGSGDPP